MAVVLESLATLSVLVFAVTSMLAMGTGLTLAQILDPLRDLRLVGKTPVANFVSVPLAAYVVVLLIPLTEAQSIGVILLATAAGATLMGLLILVAGELGERTTHAQPVRMGEAASDD